MTLMTSDRVEAVREAAGEIAARFDRKCWVECARENRFPAEQWEALGESGLLALYVPEELGGAGGGMCEMVALVETLSRAGTPQSFIIIAGLTRVPLIKYGTAEQVDRYVKPTLTGEKRMCFAITEPEAGTNSFKIRTSGRKVDGGWLLNGQKTLITGVDQSHFMVVVARTSSGDADRQSGLTLFVVDTRAQGISLHQLELVLKLPERHFQVFFDDVFVEDSAVLGQPDDGIRYLFDALNPERLMVAAQGVGLGDYALSQAADYARARAPFDRPIGAYQAVQHPLARARAHLDAARLMLYSATETFDAGGKAGPGSNMAKFLAAEAFLEAVDCDIQVHGGHGFDVANDVATLLPMARLMQNAPINNDMILNYIAEHVLDLPKSY